MFTKLTSKRLGGLALAASLVLAAGVLPLDARERTVTFTSPEAALMQGIGAYQAGVYQIAQPALAFAAERGMLRAKYFLARLYADNSGAMTDHPKAYQLFREIVEEHASKIDVDDDPRAVYVGKALTAAARYVLRGLPEINLPQNPEQAAGFLQEAATFFRELDGQFELAKLYLKGEGVPEDRRKALHWLSTLTQEGHVGAQAFLADLYWRGKVVPRDIPRAHALITVAVENAPEHERIWIEDIYQSIYCGMPPDVRQQNEGLVASFRKAYAPRTPHDDLDRSGAGLLPTRSCGDGSPLPSPAREGRVAGPRDGAGWKSDDLSRQRDLQNGVRGIRENEPRR